ncbi:uncharacterized protein LOC128953445 [Oppia nitens]|uniref:uncharacterized protein LOC128953445 n=1 Tax=Oppia nitens TaxID=1686743 RepID=UPI0023DB8CE3|nr:uncharacterized protein LOC128953445 [Oppia nitens]
MSKKFNYLLILLSVNVWLFADTGVLCSIDGPINDDMDDEIDNLIADNDRMALPYRRLPESVDSLNFEICRVFFKKELKIADYLSHKFHYNRHLRVIAANISLTRMRLWDKYCDYDRNFLMNIFKSANRLLSETRKYTEYAFRALKSAINPIPGITVPEIMCISKNFYSKFANSFNNSEFRRISADTLIIIGDSWMPYLIKSLNITDTNDCNSLNTTTTIYNPITSHRVSKQMALFDALDALIKVKY